MPIHDISLKKWGIHKARELNCKFKASDRWITYFKKKYRIKSRKISKFITYRNESNETEKLEKAKNFVTDIRKIIGNYSSDHIFNTDQSGVNYELYSNRTLSNIGEKSTFVSVFSLNSITHSYTIQPLISYDGKLFLCLKEIDNQFRPNVEKDLFQANNVITVCSTSGKLTKQLVKVFAQSVIKPNVDKDFILLLDSWSGHNKIDLYEDFFNDINCNLKIIPPGTTSYIQPCDTVLFLQWKYFIKMFFKFVAIEELNIEMRLRNNIIKMQSLIHNQMQSPLFHRMLKYSWYKSGYCDNGPESFDTIQDICFNFEEVECHVNNCKAMAFIKCSFCRYLFCFNHFFVNYHFHEYNDFFQ